MRQNRHVAWRHHPGDQHLRSGETSHAILHDSLKISDPESDTLQAMANHKSEIYKLVTTMGTEHKDEGKEREDADDSTSLIEDIREETEENATEHEQDGARIPKIDRRASIATMRRASVLSTRAAKREAVRDLKEDSRPKEKREKGAVNREVYRDYISAASGVGVASFLICILGAQATSIAGNLILRYWADVNDEEGDNASVGKYLAWYGCIGLLSSLLSVGATLLLQVFCGIRCSKQMHDRRCVITDVRVWCFRLRLTESVHHKIVSLR